VIPSAMVKIRKHCWARCSALTWMAAVRGCRTAIPADNPFWAGEDCRRYGRMACAIRGGFPLIAARGGLFVADVGQDRFEEIDIVQKGGNYGWNTMEGLHCFNPPSGCNMAGLKLPIVEISHPEAEAVIGGFIYHGTAVAALQNLYIFGDLSGKDLESKRGSCQHLTRTLLVSPGFNISSLARRRRGELYVVDVGGRVLKIIQQ